LTDGHLSRRRFLAGAGAIAGSVALGGAAGATISRVADESSRNVTGKNGTNNHNATFGSREPFYGAHQSGVATATQALGAFAGFTLLPGFDVDAARRMLRVITESSAKLTAGEPPVSDNDPELATGPARLTVTVGLGPGFFSATALESKIPRGFRVIPPYDIDRLMPEWTGGDLLLQIGSDDSLVLAHALRHLTRSIRSFATPSWVQRGFTRASGMGNPSVTPRNLMGQIDGTANPRNELDFSTQVWAPAESGWFDGGTMLVLRRIAMTLDTWDSLEVAGKEMAIGRRLSNGAPLTGTQEFDAPDLGAVGSNGLPVIPPFAHIRRAREGVAGPPFLRRSLNYDDGINSKGETSAGLIFAAYAADIERQYIPVQNALAKQDLLNKWTIPVGSAVFVIPPGCSEGGFIGDTLLT
jgi:dye decolorizing peroxidase